MSDRASAIAIGARASSRSVIAIRHGLGSLSRRRQHHDPSNRNRVGSSGHHRRIDRRRVGAGRARGARRRWPCRVRACRRRRELLWHAFFLGRASLCVPRRSRRRPRLRLPPSLRSPFLLRRRAVRLRLLRRRLLRARADALGPALAQRLLLTPSTCSIKYRNQIPRIKQRVSRDGAQRKMTIAYINRVAVATPEHDVHGTFVRFAARLLRDRRSRLLFERMVNRAQIERRWSCLKSAGPGSNESVDADGFYTLGRFPTTAQRMARYEIEAPALAAAAVDRLGLGEGARDVTHLIVTSCTGLSAPGVDLDLVRRCGLDPGVERI